MRATRAWGCAETRPSLGVYVVGAIDSAERGLADAHLAACQECRAELGGLAGLPVLLGQLDPDRAGAGEPQRAAPGGLVSDLARAGRRRRARWFLAVAAAVAVITGGVLGGLRSAGPPRVVVVPPSADGGWQTAQAASQVTGATATVAYAHRPWGTAVEVLTGRIPVGVTCQLWAVHPDGTWTQAAAWTTARDEGQVWYPGSSPGSAGAVARFEITAGHALLLTVSLA